MSDGVNASPGSAASPVEVLSSQLLHPMFSHYPSHPPPVNVPLVVLPEHDCSYLPGRQALSRAFMVGRMPGEMYHALMDAGFRRSGKLVYQPVCPGCRACVPLRVPVETFVPSKSQRRCVRKNADIRVVIGPAEPTEEKFDLYRRYIRQWHGRDDAEGGWEAFVSFLYDSPVQTLEFSYRDGEGRLLAVGICDICPRSLSSVYFYHDPANSRRGLGTLGAIHEIEAAQAWDIPYYYLGYWINGCGAMQYKSGFRPCEILHPDGVWRPHVATDV
jgi:arginyl-tRNA--protein-N-Asp/Glu arginylyltransferase